MQSEDQLVPTGYVRLAEGHQIYVPVAWLNELQGSFRGKTKSCALKLMISGFLSQRMSLERPVYSFQTHHLARPLKACLTFNLKKDKIKYI
jgi:hypothetical protein